MTRKGIATESTVCATLVGYYAILRTGSSSSNRYPTVVRVSRSGKFDVLIASQDRRRQDSMPEHIAKTAFSIANGTEYTSDMLPEATKLRSRSPRRFSWLMRSDDGRMAYVNYEVRICDSVGHSKVFGLLLPIFDRNLRVC
jgi:hypothetical protein